MRPYCPLPQGKLLRHKIPQLHEQEFGVIVTVHEILPEDPRATELFTLKLHEELAEVNRATPTQKPEEVADVLTVLQNILEHQVIHISPKLLEAAYQVVGANNPADPEVAQIYSEKKELKGDFSVIIEVVDETSPTQNP